MNLKSRILALATGAQASHEGMGKNDKFDFDAWEKEQKAFETELDAIDKEAGPGLVVGRCLTFGVADGSATYVITKIRKNDVVVEWVPLYDGYWSQAVGLSADKRHHVVLRSTAEHQCRASEVFQKLAAMPLHT